MRTYVLANALAGALLAPLAAQGAATYSDQATFLAALGGYHTNTYDFETASGFPASGGTIGVFDRVTFDAQTFEDPVQATSGTQTMTGATGTFGTASITFGRAYVGGFGFYALDLNDVSNEVVRLSVNFANGPDQVYNIGLGGQPPLTPIYFGVLDYSDRIISATILGTDDTGATRAWEIDDLSVGAVPEPSTWALFASGLLGLAFIRHRKA